jgi:serine/threonine protein kinase
MAIATAIASAGAHLHARYIMHGDLYCHNILTDNADDVLLVDYGAASFYHAADPAIAAAFERLEIRAFGCLLDDLLSHLSAAETDHEVIGELQRVKKGCMQATVLERPDFKTLSRQLATVYLSVRG